MMQQRPEVPEIDPTEAWEHAQRGDAVIVDVREADEVTQVSVPGAIHIPLGSLAQQIDTLPHDRELLMLCRSGNRSAYATQLLRNRGYDRVANVSGDVIAWTERGLPYRNGSTDQPTR